jgi:hypothetical protein
MELGHPADPTIEVFVRVRVGEATGPTVLPEQAGASRTRSPLVATHFTPHPAMFLTLFVAISHLPSTTSDAISLSTSQKSS